LREAKCIRLAKERDELIARRKKEISAIYQNCQRLLDPVLWQYLPEVNHSYEIDIIFDYIYSHEKSALLAVDEAAQKIHLLFDQWLACGKHWLLELMSKHHTSICFQNNALDLATSVFICPLHSPKGNKAEYHSALLGWEDAAVHLDCNMPRNPQQLTKNSPELLKFEYSMDGHKIALYLLGLLGLDASTPASDVEALEDRFMCLSCPLEVKRGNIKGRFALKFKECASLFVLLCITLGYCWLNIQPQISHAVSHADHPTESFLLFSKEATESIVFHESASCRQGEPSWCCKHCSLYVESYVSRYVVIRHIQEMFVPLPLHSGSLASTLYF